MFLAVPISDIYFAFPYEVHITYDEEKGMHLYIMHYSKPKTMLIKYMYTILFYEKKCTGYIFSLFLPRKINRIQNRTG